MKTFLQILKENLRPLKELDIETARNIGNLFGEDPQEIMDKYDSKKKTSKKSQNEINQFEKETMGEVESHINSLPQWQKQIIANNSSKAAIENFEKISLDDRVESKVGEFINNYYEARGTRKNAEYYLKYQPEERRRLPLKGQKKSRNQILFQKIGLKSDTEFTEKLADFYDNDHKNGIPEWETKIKQEIELSKKPKVELIKKTNL